MVQSLTLRVAEMIFWRDTDLRFGKSMEFVEILGNSWICDLGILGKSINSLGCFGIQRNSWQSTIWLICSRGFWGRGSDCCKNLIVLHLWAQHPPIEL